MDQSPSELTGPPAPPSSLMGRLINVYAAPAEVFDQIKAGPPSQANWLVPALILILVGWLGAWLVMSQEPIKQQFRDVREQAIQKQVDKGRLSQKQADAALQGSEKVAGAIMVASIAIGTPIGAFVSPVVWGLIIWLVGAKIFKGQVNYQQALEVAGLTNMIAVLGSIVKTSLALIMGNFFATPGLILLVKPFDPQNPLHAMLMAADIMTLWVLAARAIGLSRLSGASFGKAAAWVFGIWIVFTGVPIAVGAALRAATGG